MGAGTSITWSSDTFNPWWGCTKVSPGCAHCYAEPMAKRFRKVEWGPKAERRPVSDVTWKQPQSWNNIARKSGQRRRVFVGSMGDIFEARAGLDAERAKLWTLIKRTRWLDWLLLTKRPENIAKMLPGDWYDGHSGGPYSHVWIGTSVEDQQRADERCEALVDATPMGRSFVSAEPLLGPVDLKHWLWHIHWVIVGGESGPYFRPMEAKWVDKIKAHCDACGAAFFYKQDAARKQGTRADPNRWPQELPPALREHPKEITHG